MKTKTTVLTALLMAGLLASCGGDEPPRQETPAVSVTLAPVEFKAFVLPVHAAGHLTIGDEMRLSFKTGGVVDEFRVEEGDRVKRGQVLVSLKLDELQAQVDMASSSKSKAERDLERVQNLYADSVASLEQLQNAETALQVARSQHRIAAFNLEHSVIKAPADGIVLKRLVEANELVAPGTPLVLVGTTNKAWSVLAGIPDRDVVRLQVGDSARVEFDTYPGRTVIGEVTEIAAGPDLRTGTYEVAISLPPTDMKLLSGFSSKVTVYPTPENASTLIPIDALIQVDGSQGSVFTVDDRTRAARTAVQVVHILDDKVAVVGDLSSSDRVITRGSAYVTDGTPVSVTEPPLSNEVN